MRFISRSLMSKNIGSGWLYFYVHFMTEVNCFFCLSKVIGDSWILWFIPLFYDAMAFVPQSIIGAFCDRHQNVNIGLIGTVALAAGGTVLWLFPLWHPIIGIIIICFGNCCTHVGGAEVTLRCSQGRLSHSAIFVSGGSFGVITGRLLADSPVTYPVIIAMMLTSIPFVLLAELYKRVANKSSVNPCERFNYHSERFPAV
ncbi:MAG: hypothetical protein IJL87_07600, partial [Clostridia bacterium]|nr:hypothetical protein [Clostridia bacterium]